MIVAAMAGSGCEHVQGTARVWAEILGFGKRSDASMGRWGVLWRCGMFEGGGRSRSGPDAGEVGVCAGDAGDAGADEHVGAGEQVGVGAHPRTTNLRVPARTALLHLLTVVLVPYPHYIHSRLPVLAHSFRTITVTRTTDEGRDRGPRGRCALL